MPVFEEFGNLSINTSAEQFIQLGSGPDEDEVSDNDDEYVFDIPELKDSDALEEDEEATFEIKEGTDGTDVESSDDDEEELIIDPEKVERVEITKNPIEEPTQTFEETQQEEIFEDFEYEETPENIIVIEEALIPEDKVIATDKQQHDDLLNQMIKNTQNIDSNIIKHQKKILRNFELLKKVHSVFDENNNILGAKLKGDTYKPINRILNSKLFFPIVNETKNVFSFVPDEDDTQEETEDEDDDETQFIETLAKYASIEKNYITGAKRLNYSFYNHINELYKVLDTYEDKQPGFNETLNKDTDVYSNTFSDELMTYGGKLPMTHKHRLNGPIDFSRTPGNNISVIGYLQKPKTETIMKTLYKSNSKLHEIILNNNNHLFEPKINTDTLNKHTIRGELQLGDNVYICSSQETGIITNIKENDKIVVNNKEYDISDISIIPCNSLDTLNAFIFNNVENKNKIDYLDIITPSVRNIVDSFESDNTKTIVDLVHFLDTYNLYLEDISYNNIKSILNTIQNNNNKTKKYITNYEKYTQTNYKSKRSNFQFMNNKILDELKEFYGEYPLFNDANDSEEKRYNFITNQVDNGLLFFKTMIKKIEDILLGTKDRRINNLNKELGNLYFKEQNLKTTLESYKTDNQVCYNKRLVKVYYSLQDLENDNVRQISIDNDKMIHGEEDNAVDPGHYCILVYPDNTKKIYKRTESSVWKLVDDIDGDLDEELQNQVKFCNEGLIGDKVCKYSSKHKMCLSIEYLNTDKKIENVGNEIEFIKENLNKLNNLDEYIFKSEDLITSLKKDLELEFARKVRVENHFTKLNIKVNETIDELYEDFYSKIDKYLENISVLSQIEYYKGLNILLKKYGRKAFEDENENNTYCVLGNKILACNHHKYFIDYHDNNISGTELLEKVSTRYGVEHDGYIWCNNCGQEMNLAEYETIEGFGEGGSRIVTHEVLAEGTNEPSEGSGELIGVLQNMLLKGDDNSIKNSETNNISLLKIVEVITSTMGIKLKNEDFMRVLQQSETICNVHIRSKEQYMEAAKRSKRKVSDKMLEVAYSNFYNRNAILHTSAVLFMVLQTSIPSYDNFRNHNKCNPSLKGFPLDGANKQLGLDYISCILDTLRQSGKEWLYIQKINIKEQITKIINMLLKEDTYMYLYEKKTMYNKTIELQKEITTQTQWDYFKPPLNEMKMKDENITISNLTINNIQKKETQLTIKFMELLNKIILEQGNIENDKYIPTPIDNVCCLEEINNSAYLNYFIQKDSKIRIIFNNLHKINEAKKKLTSKSVKVSIKPNPKKKIETYANILFDEMNLTESVIHDFFEMYIDSGPYKGYKYIFDDYDICQLTGLNKEVVKDTKHTQADFMELYNYIKTMNRVTINSRTSRYSSLQFQLYMEQNATLLNNNFLSEFITNVSKKKTEENIKELVDEIKYEKKELIDLLDTKITINKDELKKLLDNLGELNESYDINKDKYGETIANTEFFSRKSQLIQMYLIQYILIPIERMYNGYYLEAVELPRNWRITNTDMISKVQDILLNEYEINEQYDYVSKDKLEPILLTLRTSTKNIEKIKGTKLVGHLLEYIFIKTIHVICINESDDIDINKEIEELQDEPVEDLDITRELEKKQYTTLKLMYDLLMNIHTKQSFIDKHTKNYIQSVIEQKSENDKESNLKFIQELDRETWSSLKNMISLGMDTWKNLSNKDRAIYAPDSLQQNSEELLSTEQETNSMLQNQAIKELGSNYSTEEYQSWLDNRNNNQREENLAYEERDIMSDDDE
jgi:hypothetical protein